MPPSDATARQGQINPTLVAAELGLGWNRGKGAETLTWPHVLDLACLAYWERRNNKTPAGARRTGEAAVASAGHNEAVA